MKIFNLTANAAAIFSLVSVGVDASKTALKQASHSSKTEVAINDIKNYSGDSILSKPSEKYNSMKKMVRELDITTGFHKAKGAISGFASGFAKGMKDTLPIVGFSFLTLASKNKTVKTVGVAGMGISTVWDFLKNGTNLFSKRNLIEK